MGSSPDVTTLGSSPNLTSLGSSPDISNGVVPVSTEPLAPVTPKPQGLILADIFNEDLYLELNPDVAEEVKKGKFKNGKEHFKKFGKEEKREFSLFVSSSILWENQIVKEAVDKGEYKNPIDYFLQVGQYNVSLEFSIFFSSQEYLAKNPDIKANLDKGDIKSPLEQFVKFGIKEGRQFSDFFDSEF
ncbi:MAG: beta strand repeat-containing protein, partial [Microcoleaceae cyanobacterium]